ncbi:MAG TPA: hypothetical protein ENJ08_02720 [Gammaproteobacteria bacterium]|nr:hypothetical protein [Gammaproteobacteria bacterium]
MFAGSGITRVVGKIIKMFVLMGGVLSGAAQAGDAPLQLPSIVGPELYELYTDAQFFVTRVFVNGKALKPGNAEGNGSMRRRGYSFSGPMGYNNKLVLNGYMKAGKNEIKVVFEPSSIYEDAKKQDAEKFIRQDMFAHALIVRGRLSKGSLGVESYDLDQLVASPERKVKVLKNQLIRRLSIKDLEKPVSVIYQLDLLPADKIFQADFDSCSLSKDGPTNITAMLSLNGTPIRKITGSSGKLLSSVQKLMEPGANAFLLKVDSIDRKVDKNYLKLSLECDLDSAIKKIGFPGGYSGVRFGDFFNKIYLPLVKFDFSKKGEYKAGFNISY